MPNVVTACPMYLSYVMLCCTAKASAMVLTTEKSALLTLALAWVKME